jgi:hypothetical protein
MLRQPPRTIADDDDDPSQHKSSVRTESLPC